MASTSSNYPHVSNAETNMRQEEPDFDAEIQRDEMDSELYNAVKDGDIAFIRERAQDINCSSFLFGTRPYLDTILHVAASSGNEEVVKVIIEWCLKLLMAKNSTGDLALHVAVRAGHLPIVKILVSFFQQLEDECSSEIQPLQLENNEGHRPLHLALINKYQEVDLEMKTKYNEVATFLIETNPKMFLYPCWDNELKCPFAIAARAKDTELMKLIANKVNELEDSDERYSQDSESANVIKVPDRWVISTETKTSRPVGSIIIAADNDLNSSNSQSSGDLRDEEGLDGTEYKAVDPSVIATRIKPDLYKAVKSGNITYIRENLTDIECSPPVEKSPKLNTILHIAVSTGHVDLVQEILKISGCQELVTETNSSGDLALHVAANAGHLLIVQYLVSSSTQQTQDHSTSTQMRTKNKEGNTPLHLALIKKYQVSRNCCNFCIHAFCQDSNLALETKYNEVVEFLVETDAEVSYDLNNEGKSPLYLAVKAGDTKLVQLMKNKASHPPDVNGKSVAHAAIYAAFTRKNKDVLDIVFRQPQHPIIEQEDNELTPFSYAASIGYLDGVQYLLKIHPDCAYKSDQNGYFPIHRASRKGHIHIIDFFLEQYPDMSELLNRKGQNILHVAAVSGQAKLVAYMIKRIDLELLINEKDNNGNTPLHLASEANHPMVISILTWDNRLDLKSLNKKGQTALNIAGNYSGTFPSFRQRLTWLALRYVGAPRAPPRAPQGSKSMVRGKDKYSTDKYKDMVNTLLLVATLVATITFAAAFTMPGGYNGTGGVATFLEKHMFHIFVICNTIAMYSSITIVVALIWAQLGDLKLVRAAFEFTVPILGLALTMVSMAFMSGNYLVLRNLNWLAYLVLIIGSVFLLALSVLFLPLCLPTSKHNPIPRYILYYAFLLLIKVTKSDINNDGEEE